MKLLLLFFYAATAEAQELDFFSNRTYAPKPTNDDDVRFHLDRNYWSYYDVPNRKRHSRTNEWVLYNSKVEGEHVFVFYRIDGNSATMSKNVEKWSWYVLIQ